MGFGGELLYSLGRSIRKLDLYDSLVMCKSNKLGYISKLVASIRRPLREE